MKVKLTIAAFLLMQSFNSILFAESKPEQDPDKGLPKSGVLSNSYSASGGRNSTVAIPWNKEGAAPDTEAPVTGSVSRISDKKWSAKVFNNSEDSFNVDVRVRQFDKNGNSIRSDYFSFRLKPKQSAERLVTGASGTVDSQLELVSWKRIASPDPTATPEVVPTVKIEPKIEPAPPVKSTLPDRKLNRPKVEPQQKIP